MGTMPETKKLLNKLRDEIHFPYSITSLSLVLEMLGFKYKKPQRESIIHERADLVAWRESFMRRIQEIRKNEPDREIVHTDETWLNAGHRIKREWVDLEALQNPRRSNLGKCHFLPGGGAPENWGGIRYFFLDQKGGSKDFFK